MNTPLLCLAFLLALTQVSAILPVCLPNQCATVKCQAFTEDNCSGKIVPNGGYCGCCDACYSVISEGGFCGRLFILLDLPVHSVCADGLVCNPDTEKCEASAEH